MSARYLINKSAHLSAPLHTWLQLLLVIAPFKRPFIPARLIIIFFIIWFVSATRLDLFYVFINSFINTLSPS
jgi:hypothetical protein